MFNMLNQADLSAFEKLFLALCDQTRLRLLSLMADGRVSVGYLAEKLGESQPKTSRHLAYLRNAGLVYTAREGKWIYYGVEMQADPAVQNILTATIKSVSGQTYSTGRPIIAAARDDAISGNNDAPAALTEWRPNEIDVHLL